METKRYTFSIEVFDGTPLSEVEERLVDGLEGIDCMVSEAEQDEPELG